MPLKYVVLALAAVVLTACSASADPSAPAATTSHTAPTAAAPPYRLDRHAALDSLRTPLPRGFSRVLTCRRRRAEGCAREGTAGSRWFVGTLARGAPLPRGNGLSEEVTATATAWPSAARARRYARTIERRLRRYRGEYYFPLRMTGPRRYIPGDRGKGELERVSLGGWRGLGLRRRYFLYFDHYVTSGTVLGGRFVLRRGRYVSEVEWKAATQATDRRLSHLPARLLQNLS